MQRKIYLVALVMLTMCTLSLHAQDLHITDASGDDPAEKATIEDSRAHTSIKEFRKAILRAEATYGKDPDQCRQAVDNMVMYYHNIKKQDPGFDMSKYEATYNKYAGQAEAKQQQEQGEKAKDDAGLYDPTTGRVANKVRSLPNMYYSALVSQGKRDDFFYRSIRPNSKDFIPNAVHYEAGNNDNPVVTYYKLSDFVQPREIEERSLSRDIAVQVKADANITDHHKDNAYYDIFKCDGIIVETDGTITVFHIPAKNNDYQFDKTSADVLAKDLATAKSADLNARKEEAIKLIKAVLKSRDEAAQADRAKTVNERRKTTRGMSNASLESEMKSLLVKALPETRGNSEMRHDKPECKYTVTSFYIIDRDWAIVRNDLGIILGRRIAVESTLKGSNGKCFLRRYAFYEQNSGGSNYGAPYLEYELYWPTVGDDGEGICENLK